MGIASETLPIGFDGIWVSPEGQALILEVKTTDAYRISLDSIIGYRDRLMKAGQIVPPSSVLIVVGREDTGELEAQIRGSRHAWDMRLISADALIKLVQLKENSEGSETGQKIRSLLIPREYTRLDEMIDVMFTTAKEVENVPVTVDSNEVPLTSNSADVSPKLKGAWEFTDSGELQAKREAIVAALAQRDAMPLIKKSRALYWSPDHSERAAFTISKRYTRKGGPQYWYAYHPQWEEFLNDAEHSYFVLGCMDRDHAFAIPAQVLHPLLKYLNKTIKDDGSFLKSDELAPHR
jgi:hypothetical protein